MARYLLRSSKQAKAHLHRRFHAGVERLEVRTVLNATVSGTVLQLLDVAGLNPAPQTGSFLSPISGVAVSLDHGAKMQNSQPNGSYSFSDVASGTHSVSIKLPSGYLG